MRSTTQVLTTEEASTTKETSTTGKVTTKKSTTRKISTAKSTTSRSSLSTTPKLNESTTTQEEPELKDYWGNYDNFYPKLLTCKFRLSEKLLKCYVLIDYFAYFRIKNISYFGLIINFD
jgi:hypothetical protein